MLAPSATITVIGFGAAGRVLGAALAQRGCAVRAYDLLLDDAAARPAMQQRIERAGVDPAFTLVDALRGAKLIISTVSTSSSQAVACDASRLLSPGQIFLDMTSISQNAQRSNAALIETQGASYAAAAMPMSVQSLAAPMLLTGTRAGELAPALNALGFAMRVATHDNDDVMMDAPPAELVAAPPCRGELP